MTKKEPATETNPQQALGFIKYVVCPFVIINVACIFTRSHKDKYCFSLSQIRIQKKNDRQRKAQQPFNPRPYSLSHSPEKTIAKISILKRNTKRKLY